MTKYIRNWAELEKLFLKDKFSDYHLQALGWKGDELITLCFEVKNALVEKKGCRDVFVHDEDGSFRCGEKHKGEIKLCGKCGLIKYGDKFPENDDVCLCEEQDSSSD